MQWHKCPLDARNRLLKEIVSHYGMFDFITRFKDVTAIESLFLWLLPSVKGITFPGKAVESERRSCIGIGITSSINKETPRACEYSSAIK